MEQQKAPINVSTYPRHYAQKPAARSDQPPAPAQQPAPNTSQQGPGTNPDKHGPSNDEYRQWQSGYSSKPGQRPLPQPHTTPQASVQGFGGSKPMSQVRVAVQSAW